MSESLVNYKEPRYVHIFGKDIEPDTVQELISVLHSHEKVDLYFYTDGGLLLAMEALINYMNQHPDLNVYCTYQIYSCGFDIIMKYNGKIFLTKELDFFMVHGCDRKSYSKRKYDWDNSKLIAYTQERNVTYCNLLKENHNFTDEEIKEIMDGGDIYLYRDDFERIIGDKTNITIL